MGTNYLWRNKKDKSRGEKGLYNSYPLYSLFCFIYVMCCCSPKYNINLIHRSAANDMLVNSRTNIKITTGAKIEKVTSESISVADNLMPLPREDEFKVLKKTH